MQIALINNRAQQKYGALVGALDLVSEAFDAVDKVIDGMDPGKASGGWTVATPDELRGMRTKAFEAIERFRAGTKKYEAELVSRDWRL
ncbi:hypothetical protein DMH04_30255 [Kibdelosporangium aridum]|uniref:Uncharacterized protein n=1 Tax=Kibdelosporangium aridum TaxID=2030 RepID=A0A428Z3B8_KIBAR|nr:hypothetical protein [Kibdelosporangium aridum]RSM80416.1 hypothetical protein DMH04_30255 [Kibdelosporangium aridum]